MTPVTLPDLATHHDAFLVDQFGVLLDGTRAYPDAPAALRWLANQGKPVILLSNSGKRSRQNSARLVQLGFDRTSFQLVLSSGEAAFRSLQAQNLAPGTRIWLHSRDGDTSAVDGLPVVVEPDPTKADRLIVAGSLGDQMTLEDYTALLQPAARAGRPMLCTNPDMQMLTPHGLRFGAGRIAQLYEDLGGQVTRIGKPHPLIYAEAARLLPNIAPARILCIGDSPAHDIAGGHAAGHATALVRTGLHADLSPAQIADLCAREHAIPDFILPRFSISED